MPRNKKIWVFGSTFGKRFADNPKYFYLYLKQNHIKSIHAIWISKNKSVVKLLRDNAYESYYLYSCKGIWFSLRAKVYFYDNYSKDICFTLSGGAVKINMWHGIPLKKIQKDNLFDRVRNPKSQIERLRGSIRRWSDEKPTDYVLATSAFLEHIYKSAFQTNNVIICGYPRNDILNSELIRNLLTDYESSTMEYLKKQCKDHKLILYMPTFRDSEKKFFEVISIQQFKSFLEREKLYFCVKLHPKTKMESAFKEISCDNIIIIDSQADPYPLLKIADLLITDYSSIYFDFLLTKKPIIFFVYDYEEYLKDSRDLYFDYEEFTPGRKVFTQEELEEAITEVYQISSEAEGIYKKIFNETSFGASEHLYLIVKNILEISN